MKQTFALFLILMVLFGSPSTVWAANEVPLPAPLQKLKDDGGQIDFLGHAYGLDGWRVVGKDGGDAKYAYTTPEGAILLGLLLNPDGTSVTTEQLKAFKNKLDGGQNATPGAEKAQTKALKAEKMYAEIEKAAWAFTGDDKAPYLYIFINALCGECQAYWHDLEPHVKSGKLQVRFVPFGKMEENRNAGAALLSVPDPATSWNAFMRGETNVLSKDKIKPGLLERIDENTKLFSKWSLKGPPFTIYRRPSDGHIIVIAGPPANLMLVMADLLKPKEEAP